MRKELYQLLVNRQAGIAQRYHRVHDGRSGIGRLLSYLYLLWLNFAFYALFCKWLGQTELVSHKGKGLPERPESESARRDSADSLAERLAGFDVVSFDIFDTLVFRPFSEPTELFFLVGQKLGYMDFRRLRIEAERQARIRKAKRCGSYEVELAEIWAQLEQLTGIDAEYGMQTEIGTELELCYANPYMQKVFRKLQEAGKRIVITSDMYLKPEVLQRLLEKCGYEGCGKLFVSCVELVSKGNGGLFERVKQYAEDAGGGGVQRLAHVGDNPDSDVKMAQRHGFSAFLYPNVNRNAAAYRSYDLSPVIGGAYRGLVDNRLYAGEAVYNLQQEYGYVYGGLFVLGYCSFIHEYCRLHRIEKVLFIARDGEILKKAYDLLYPGGDTQYVYLSRLAAAKLAAGYFRYDYMRKLVYHKVGQQCSLRSVLQTMELEELSDRLETEAGLRASDSLEQTNAERFVNFLNRKWETILDIYKEQREAAGVWYKRAVGQAKRAAAVDIGWAGSGALALKTLFEKEWHIPCALTGIVAGTNTAYSAEPDMSETMLLDGSLVSYLFSSGTNRDLWKKHDPAKMYNIYFELLTSSEQPSFQGFYFDGDGKVELRFRKPEKNAEGIRNIQQGILDFVTDYENHFGAYPCMFRISGRDAYAPMLRAAEHQEKYLRRVMEDFDMSVGV